MPEGIYSISAIIPTLGRNSILNSLESIAYQTLKPTSVFIADDSEQQKVNVESNAIATTLIRTGGNKGHSFARNLGRKRSKSNLIAFLDDDDVWLTHHLEYSNNQMRTDSLDAIYTSALINGRRTPRITASGGMDPLIEMYSQRFKFRLEYYLPTLRLVIRDEVANHIEFYERLRYGEYVWFTHKIFEFGFKMQQTQEIMVIIEFDRKRQR